jgi:phospholipid/cholesterol/gamma-HCH transport system ATP-binding protein
MTAAPGREAHVELDDVRLSFGGRDVLRGVSCSFPRGRISVILGGSGAGKTTILRLIGGLVRPQSGRVVVAGVDVAAVRENELYAVRDKLGMMFQGGALLDSLTVFDNLALPLREHTGKSETEIAAEVKRSLGAVGLADAEPLLPGQLSGGMIKRTALARALVLQPEILLCDEPFSGLDPISVKRIEGLLCRINQELGVTMLVSSHHVRSTIRMADRIVLLVNGQAVTGTPAELRASDDPWIHEFLDDGATDERITDAGVESLEPERRPIL